MPQTTYLVDNVAAIPGQVVEKGRVCGKYTASEEIPAGRFVELYNGQWRLPQGTSLGKIGGVAMYRASREPGPYAVDEYVSVLRAGVIWCDSTATTIADLASANLRHSSTISTHRGKVTDAAVATGAGVEISDPGPVNFYGSGPADLALVELAFPGADSDDDTRLDALEAVQVLKKSVTVAYNHASLVAEGDDGDAVIINIGTALPADAVVLAHRVKVNTAFAGAGLANLTLDVGGTDADGIVDGLELLALAAGQYSGAVGTTRGVTPSGPYSAQQLTATFDPDGAAGLDELTAGSVTIDVFYFVLA